MPKFDLDYSKLHTTVEKKTYKYADIKHKLVKVAFDIFKIKDGNPDELWQIQSADDGDFIVAKYETTEPVQEKTASVKTQWTVLVSEASGELSVFYKNYPITKLSSAKLGISKEQLSSVPSFLPKKLASEKSFVGALLSTLNPEVKATVLTQYPELAGK